MDQKIVYLVIFSLVFVSSAHAAYNNSCLYQKQVLNRYGPRTFDCAKFVIDSTDEIWNMNRSVEWVYSKLDKYMTNDWESVTNYGEYLHGMPLLRKLVMQTLTAFPDIKLHIVDTYCEGNDIDGYKTTMPVVHTATHLGWHPVFGPPTGKKIALVRNS